jgi:hypothetical protein
MTFEEWWGAKFAVPFQEKFWEHIAVKSAWDAAIEQGRAEMRAPMACGHPKVCEAAIPFINGEPEIKGAHYTARLVGCLACSAIAQGKKDGRREALEEATKAVCVFCREGQAPRKRSDDFVHGPFLKTGWNCYAEEIHRLLDKESK